MLIGQCRECYTRRGGAGGTVFCAKCLEVHRLEAERRRIDRAERSMFSRIADLIEPQGKQECQQTTM